MRLLPYTLPRFLLRMNLAVAYADPKKLSDATLTRYQDMMLAPGVRQAILARTQQVFLQPPEQKLAKISAPTLIIWGEDDRMIPFSNSADYLRDIPHAKRVPLPGLGHVPFEENPAGSLPPVLAFLNRGAGQYQAVSIYRQTCMDRHGRCRAIAFSHWFALRMDPQGQDFHCRRHFSKGEPLA
jgi:pimeloyl-ACP methyl ester carboxylesterase